MDSGPSVQILPPFSSHNSTYLAAHVIIREPKSFSYDDVEEAVGKLIHDHLKSVERNQVIRYRNIRDYNFLCKPATELVWKEVRKIRIKYVELKVDLNLRTVYSYAYVFAMPRRPRLGMSTLGFGLMEFCSGVAAAAVTDCCSICLMEIDSATTLRMQCRHLFHADCIVIWLRKSHYCPLCRNRMPRDQFLCLHNL